MTTSEILSFKSIGFFTPAMQMITICILFVASILQQYREYKATGKVWSGRYPLKTSSFFVGIYEEVIFRGIILVALLNMYSAVTAVVVSSLLFGLWHLKNIFYFSKRELWYQMLYSGLVFGPIVAILTIITGTIWLAVIVHYLNNLLASRSLKVLNT